LTGQTKSTNFYTASFDNSYNGDWDVFVTKGTEQVSQPGTLQFTAASSDANETAGQITINVSRTGGSDGAVSVDCGSNDGTATGGGVDFNDVNTTLNWTDGDTADKTCAVTIIDDNDVEGNENFTLNLSGATGGATIGGQANHTITIIDDDDAGTLAFTIAASDVNENAGQAAVSVTRSGGVDGAASVDCDSSDITATAGADYTAVVSQTLNWADQEGGSKDCTVTILDDNDVENDEDLRLTLSGAVGAALGAQTTHDVTIIDDDNAGTLQFAAATSNIAENGGQIQVTVSRTGGTDGAVSVDCDSSDGTATAGSDYTAVASQTLNWADGDGADKTCDVTITDDNDVEGNETFTLTLSGITGGAVLGGQTTNTVTITDDDNAGTLQFTAAASNVNENAGQATITVSRTGGNDGAVSVDCDSTGGTATAGTDYTAVNSTLNWADQDSADKTCTVNITDDTDVESAETVVLTLSGATGGAALGGQTTHTVTIIDDDVAGGSDVTSATGSGTITIGAPSSGNLANETAMDADAQENQSGRPAGVTFPDGLVSFDITGLANGEQVTVTLNFPTSFGAGTQYYKYDDVNGFRAMPTTSGEDDGAVIAGNTVTLTLTDGGIWDTDGVANGSISDPGGPGVGGSTTPAGGSGSGGGSGACFIATAAYGSYQEPHVWVLREFRDKILLTNSIGKAFVSFYYETSPPIADFISRHDSLRMVTRTALLPLYGVAKVTLAVGPVGSLIIFGFIFPAVTAAVVYRRRRNR
jgi:hypothetical protein